MVQVRCQCGKKLKLPPAHIDKPAACPNCRKHLRMVAAGIPQDESAAGGFMIESGPQRVGELVFLLGDQPITVGKSAEAVLSLRSSDVSRLHCRLVTGPHGWRIEDNNSTNGVLVNGRKVKGHNLRDGDAVKLGAFVLRYASNLASTPTEAPVSVAASAAGVIDDGVDEHTPADSPLPLISEDTETTAVASPTESPNDSGFLNLLDDDEILADHGATVSTVSTPATQSKTADGPTCPSCKRQLPAGTKICVQCGINIKTGRQLLTSQETNLNETYATTEGLLTWISWIIPMGVYPIASEAFGLKKPYVVRTTAIVTVLISAWFLILEYSNSDAMRTQKNLMLWVGDPAADPEQLEMYYYFTNWGDEDAFSRQMLKLEESEPDEDKRILAAHNALSPQQQAVGHFHTYQLITHAFLHADIFHLLGNLLFLMVFGSRVNALIGTVATAVVYPILAVGAAIAHMMSLTDASISPMLGASGAIMGLAGMYFVFFPVHKVHVAAWWRWGLIRGFSLSLSIFEKRGFWVVLFYVAFDVVFTLIGAEDGVAHWAHLGGFIIGAVLALLLMVTRLVNARGGDLITVILGRRAWAIVGRPSANRHADAD